MISMNSIAAVLVYWLLLAPSTQPAPPTDTIYRSNVDLKSRKSESMSPDIAYVIDRFQDTLNGVSKQRSSLYDGRSSASTANTQRSPSPTSALAALLKVINRLQNIGTVQQGPNTYRNDGGGGGYDANYLTSSVDAVPQWTNDTLTTVASVNEESPTVQPEVYSVTLDNADGITLESLDNVTVTSQVEKLDHFNVSALEAIANVSLDISNLTSSTDVSRLSVDDVTPEVTSEDELEVNSTGVVGSKSVSGSGSVSSNETEAAVDEQMNEDMMDDEGQGGGGNLEERFAAFQPSVELIRGVTNPPEFVDEEAIDEEEQMPIGEQHQAAPNNTTVESSSLKDDLGSVEVTTLSGDEFFSTKPFLEGLVNLTTITEEDLSTVASIAISQSSIATSSSLSEDDPSFINNRNSPQLSLMKTCTYNEIRYVSGQNIDQSDPCHFCVCIDGEVTCYWKNCPPAPDGCVDLDFEGVCHRSLYLCPIPVKGQPLPFADNNVRKLRKRDVSAVTPASNTTKLTCDILGVQYRVGELVGVASDPCMECRCALDSLYCSPKCCFQPTAGVAVGNSEQDPSKSARAEDPLWFPVLANPLMHLRSEFENDH